MIRTFKYKERGTMYGRRRYTKKRIARSYRKRNVTRSYKKKPYARQRKGYVRKPKHWTQRLGPWPNSCRMPAFAGRVLAATSTNHHLTGYADGVSSSGLVKTPCSYRFHASLNTSSSTTHGPGLGWSTISNNSWGTELYSASYVNQERYFLNYIHVKLFINQVNEQGRVRVCFANPTERTKQTASLRYNWDADVMATSQNPHYWRVIKTYNFKFDNDMADPATSRLRRSREINVKIPVKRWFNTKTGSAPANAATWDAVDWNEQFWIFIDSDDAASTDSETFQYVMYIDYNFDLSNV